MTVRPSALQAPQAYISLGANLGDTRATLDAAQQALAALPGCRLIAQSSRYRTRPVGFTEQPDFLNAVILLETRLLPLALLAALLEIERQYGRIRNPDGVRFGPRTLDLDLLLYQDAPGHMLHMQTPTLTLPHPRMLERAFVLVPLAEIAPHLQIARLPASPAVGTAAEDTAVDMPAAGGLTAVEWLARCAYDGKLVVRVADADIPQAGRV